MNIAVKKVVVFGHTETKALHGSEIAACILVVIELLELMAVLYMAAS